MSLLETMLNARKSHVAADFGLQFALSEPVARAVFAYLAPLFGDAVVRLMLSPQGLVALLSQLATPQHQLDSDADDLFLNSRILANGTGLLSLLFHNEATIRIVATYAAEGAHADAAIVRRMLPYVASLYLAALAQTARGPLERLAARLECGDAPVTAQGGIGRLTELVLAASSPPPANQTAMAGAGSVSIRDILLALARSEREEERTPAESPDAGRD